MFPLTVTIDIHQELVLAAPAGSGQSSGVAVVEALSFRHWCPSPYAALRWAELMAAAPGQEVVVERSDDPAVLVQLTALGEITPGIKNFSARPLTAADHHQAVLEKVSRHVMALVSDLVIISDAAGHITYASEGVQRHLGHAVPDILGTSVALWFGEDHTRAFELSASGQPKRAPAAFKVRHQDGSWKTLDITAVNLLSDPLIAGVLLVARDITEEQRAHQELAEQQLLYQEILEDLPYQVAVLDAQGRYQYVNPAAVKSPEVRSGIIGLTDEEYCRWRGHDPVLAATRQLNFEKAASRRHQVSWEESMVDVRGQRRYHRRHYLPVFGEDGQLSRMIGYGRDDTERQRNLAMNLQQTRILQLSAQGAPLPDLMQEVVAALQDYFYGAQVTLHWEPLLPEPEPQEGSFVKTAAIAAGSHPTGMLQLRHHVPEDNAQRVLDHMAQLSGMVIERALHLEQLEQLAYSDALTALPNRAAFVRTLEAARHIAPLAIVALNLQRFRQINDRYGHATGDAVLVQVARQLQTGLPTNHGVARIGGDEFGIICEVQVAEQMATCLTQILTQPFTVRGEALQISLYIGLNPEIQPEDSAEEMIEKAEHAVHRARRLGQAISRYDPEDQAVELTAMELESQLRQAFRERNLSLAFQPLVTSQGGALHSMEVLLRWVHPERGTISPQVFIALAEQSSLILDIGEWVLREACQQAVSWPGGPIRINVNVSARQFEQPLFVETVRQALKSTGLPAHFLELELTESVLMTSDRAVVQVLDQLNALGVRLALDDYGTGYSSLAYLKRFPLDVLKIDRSFVQGLGIDAPGQKDLAIVRSTIALAHELGLQVVAEGIESERQQSLLLALGCDLMQGYFFSAPMGLGAAQSWSHGPSVSPRAVTNLPADL